MFSILKKRWNHFMHPIQGEIWCLHRVLHDRSRYPSNRELEITPEYLENLVLSYKKCGYKFVSIDSFFCEQSFITPRKRVNVSFDDGFKDVYTNAYPIFKKHNIPFTIYLTTGMPDGFADLWWLQMEKEAGVDDYESMIKEIYRSGCPMSEKMHELTNTMPDLELCRKFSLSWDELKEMVESGLCTIGSHTVSHPGLDRIDKHACENELLVSRERIKEKLSVEVCHFSYPHSMRNEFVQKSVADAGYLTATLGYGGSVRRGDNPYNLNRRFIVQQ